MALLIKLARSPLARWLMGWVFEHMSFIIPVDRLRDTPTLVAFRHPQPNYPVHILLMPKKALHSFADLSAADAPFLIELTETVQSLVSELNLASTGYRLIVNGGSYQDVPQLHFHLVAGAPLTTSEKSE